MMSDLNFLIVQKALHILIKVLMTVFFILIDGSQVYV